MTIHANHAKRNTTNIQIRAKNVYQYLNLDAKRVPKRLENARRAKLTTTCQEPHVKSVCVKLVAKCVIKRMEIARPAQRTTTNRIAPAKNALLKPGVQNAHKLLVYVRNANLNTY